MGATMIARSLAAGHGDRALFTGLELVLAPGDVIGLVGANGAGKSTLLRILAGLEAAEAGTVELSPSTATIGHLPQEPERRPAESLAAFLRRRTGVGPAEASMEAAATALAAGGAGAEETYALALERWLGLGGGDLAARTAVVVAELGLEVSLEAEMTTLSGGEAARAGLASLLLSHYDVFLLDEPTNDLDLDGLDRLERFVRGLEAPAILVSHDREFLARTVTGVVELDLAQRKVHVHGGGYDAYLAERELRRRHAREAFEAYADTRTSLEERARRQRGWMEKGVRNARRKAPDNDKLGRKYRAETSEKQAAKARQTERAIERLDVVEAPRREWELQMTIASAPRAGTIVAALDGATVRRGDFVLGPVTLQIDWGDRIAITGANGSGKSTLLAALLGRTELDAGSRRLGPSVVVGEIDQARRLFLDDRPLIESWCSAAPGLTRTEARTLLAKFGLGGDHVRRPAATLSPGERTRAALGLLQARGVNLLVLDEPTNHLDLPAIEQLEAALAGYPGTLLLVTHDRRMLAVVATNRRFQVEAGRVSEG
jgi:ATPase subunit of ABC transporter with duplicated ATPase domains